MSEQDMLKHSEKFAPYRSVFMWYMWRVEDDGKLGQSVQWHPSGHLDVLSPGLQTST